MQIRAASRADAGAIVEIWNPVIRDTTVTFNSVEKSVDDVVDLISERRRDGREFYVAQSDSELLGFATYGQFRAGVGYAFAMEHTIILGPNARGKGIGRALLTAIESHAREAGAHSMIGGISGENLDAQAFHARMGYPEVGRVPEAGRKFGRWIDIVFMQKIL